MYRCENMCKHYNIQCTQIARWMIPSLDGGHVKEKCTHITPQAELGSQKKKKC